MGKDNDSKPKLTSGRLEVQARVGGYGANYLIYPPSLMELGLPDDQARTPFSLWAAAGSGEPLEGVCCCCCLCVLFNKIDGYMVTFRMIIQTAGVEDGSRSGSREIH